MTWDTITAETSTTENEFDLDVQFSRHQQDEQGSDTEYTLQPGCVGTFHCTNSCPYTNCCL